MMRNSLFAVFSLLMLASCSRAWASLPPQPEEGEYIVRLKPTSVTRAGISHAVDMFGMMPAQTAEELVKGETDIGGSHVSFYLPARGPYSLHSKNVRYNENTSTLMSVDANADGVLARSERWWCSTPIRLADRMFQVKRIDPDGTWIELAPSDAPLTGVIVGKPFPDFTLTTTDGREVTLGMYKGKSVLIDIWSGT